MKLETVKSRLGKIISRADKIVSKQQNLPVLNALYLHAKKDGLLIKATNLDLGVEILVPAKISEEGVCAVPAHIISSFLNTLNDDDKVSLEVVDGVLEISTNESTTHIKTIPHEDFPNIPKVTKEKSVSIDVEKITTGFRLVASSAAVSSMKPELSSVYVYVDEKELVFVATDSFRLAEKRYNFSGGGFDDGVIIPAKNVMEVVKILEGSSGDVVIAFSDGQISFEVENVYITSRIVDGVFPNYKQIIPSEFNTKVTVLKDEVVDALRMANIFSDRFNKVTLGVDAKKGMLSVSTQNNDIGDTTKNIQSSIEGDSLSINFNYNYLVDGFSVISDQSMYIQCNGETKPVILRGKKDASLMYLVMPMNK